jgi:hypothetical protein
MADSEREHGPLQEQIVVEDEKETEEKEGRKGNVRGSNGE